jgi:hypothetical protein
MDTGVHGLVELSAVEADAITTYSIAALGTDGRHSQQRVCLTYNPKPGTTWSLSEGGAVHKGRYILIGALYRHWKYGGSLLNRSRELSIRTASFVCVDIPVLRRKTVNQKNEHAQMLESYCHHVKKERTISFEEAQTWLKKDPSIAVLKPSESICFHCSGNLRQSSHRVKLLTRYGEQSIVSEKRTCENCSFKFRHTDISSGIMMHGQTAYHVSLMVQLDIMMKRQGNLALHWNV